jgi:dynactin complex subunit
MNVSKQQQQAVHQDQLTNINKMITTFTQDIKKLKSMDIGLEEDALWVKPDKPTLNGAKLVRGHRKQATTKRLKYCDSLIDIAKKLKKQVKRERQLKYRSVYVKTLANKLATSKAAVVKARVATAEANKQLQHNIASMAGSSVAQLSALNDDSDDSDGNDVPDLS